MLGPLGRLPFPQSQDRAQQGVLRAGTLWAGSQGEPAARPDGSGRALALYQLSLVDAWRQKGYGLIGDAYFLSDRFSGPAIKPTQASWLLGMALDRDAWRLEAGREEHRPLDRAGVRYQAWRTSFVARWGGGAAGPALPPGFTDSRASASPVLAGDWGVTWYFFNKSLPARLDRTGVEHLRYSLHGTYGPPGGLWRLIGAVEAPTSGARWGVSEVDASVGASARWGDGDLAVTREIHQAVDRHGFAAWWQVALSWAFGSPS
ncbi:MAG: hypothetical protein KGL53_16250 [Elusimicrobia bacterium]|nr:hypothetical protein [Elusimicrobiota bacterium]